MLILTLIQTTVQLKHTRTVVDLTINNFQLGELTYSGTGIGTEKTAYSGFKRNFIDYTPSLICSNNNDKFTLKSTLGNGDLDNPIGLLTLDEYLMAGAGAYNDSTGELYYYNNSMGAYYLFNNNSLYWTMTPINMNEKSVAYNGLIYNDGSIASDNVTGPYSVRPVVSLKSSSITGGTGTSGDPFVVGGTNDTPICLKGAGC